MWTSDRFWLETLIRIRTRIADGYARVEMEDSAIVAFPKLRGVPLAHVVYGGDDLAGEA